jgi:acyl dehydratase
VPGLYFEEFEVGKLYKHASGRTVTETDNLLFTSLCMNSQPLHLDEEFASKTFYGQRVVTSIFTLGLVLGMSVGDLVEGTSLGNLGFTEITFPAPVFIGDTIHAETTVIDKRLSKTRPNSGIVTFGHVGRKQDDTVVLTCERQNLSMCKPGPGVA